MRSYNAIHGTNFETSDITTLKGEDLGIVDKDKYTYILTYSFPCTDLSISGKGLGMSKGSGTRSALLWEVERLLRECEELPQVLVMENVPQVHSPKNKPNFDMWIDFLKGLGYSNFWQDLAARDYGIPQTRNRCFMVSILGDYTYAFPEKIPLEKDAFAYLESEVDEKYYLKSETAKKLIDNLEQNGTISTEQNRTEQNRTERSSTCHSENRRHEQSLTVYQDEPTEEFPTGEQRELAYLNRKVITKRNVSIATTLTHRDYKGFGTGFNYMNGVIEWEQKDKQ